MRPFFPEMQDTTRQGRVFLCSLLAVAGLIFAFFLWHYLQGLHWREGMLFDEVELLAGRDFLNFWMMGKSAWLDEPGRFYDFDAYNQALSSSLGPYPKQNWSYPPTLMLFAAPFGALPYGLGCIAFLLLGGIAFFWVAGKASGWENLLLLLSPASYICLTSGQASYFWLAAFILIFRWWGERPHLAGILIGLLSIKPQLGLLFPFILIATGRWRVFATASATTLLLLGIASGFFGFDTLVAYVQKSLPIQNLVLIYTPPLIRAIMPTFYFDLRLLGFGYGAALLAQCLLASSIAGMCCRLWAKNTLDSSWELALFAAASIAITPYFMAYDCLILTWGMIQLLRNTPLPTWAYWLCAALYLLPALSFATRMAGIPGISLIPIAFVFLLPRMTGKTKILEENRP